MKLKEQILEITILSIVIIILIVSIILYVSCATTFKGGIDKDPTIFNICLESCYDRYYNCQGTKHYERISPRVIRCVCITRNGDHAIYLNYTESEVEGSTTVDQL